MVTLPEKVRKNLEKLVNSMKARDTVYGIALFGSVSRDEVAPSSDVDLLVIDEDLNEEYVERVGVGGISIDLDHIPRQWIQNSIPPKIDQKLFEMQILYDRDWTLTNTKLLMTKCYGSPERVDIRVGAHVVDSDVYLSRATSAFYKNDFQSASLFAAVALETALKILMEVALEPLSNSHFIERLARASSKLGLTSLFEDYLVISKLKDTSGALVKNEIKLYRTLWDDVDFEVRQSPERLNASHFSVKTKMEYYLNSSFLQGVLLRASDLADSGKFMEALHYMNVVFRELLETYLWLKSSNDPMRIDVTTAIRSLRALEHSNAKKTEIAIKFFSLDDVDKQLSTATVRRVREMIRTIRSERKMLIKDYLTKG